jgi:hypothetical protein
MNGAWWNFSSHARVADADDVNINIYLVVQYLIQQIAQPVINNY